MTGAVIGAVDAGAKVAAEADDDNKTKTAGSKSAGSTSKNKSSVSNKKSATDKKTKTGK